ncbi:hypothetical protein EV174_003898, partial [Coemansia sp. RSA 2320]
MEHLSHITDDTISLLARQGYAAQSRRQKVSLRTACYHGGASLLVKDNAHFSAKELLNSLSYNIGNNCAEGWRLAAKDRVKPIDMLISNDPTSLRAHSADTSPSSYTSSFDLADPGTPSSPLSRSLLHERFSAQLQCVTIEEEDGDDGVVIHNGLKRLSMSEAGLLLQGRPRIVN